MDILKDDIGLLVLRPVSREEDQELVLDGKSLKVILALDGKKTLIEVAKRLNLTLSEIRPIIKRLLDGGLVEISEGSIAKVDREFFQFLLNQLAIAIGPLAQIVLEDAVYELNSNVDNFPVTYLAELIDIISKEIPREEKRAAFMKNVLSKMKEKGY